MKILSGKTRLLLAVLVAAGLGGLASALVLTYAGTGRALAAGPPGVLARGDFRSVEWGTRGPARITRSPQGTLRLVFGHAFRTQKAPELFVYFAKGYRSLGSGRRAGSDWELVAPLRNWYGAQEYDLPASAIHRLGSYVLVYCAKCSKIWGYAKLAPSGLSRS